MQASRQEPPPDAPLASDTTLARRAGGAGAAVQGVGFDRSFKLQQKLRLRVPWKRRAPALLPDAVMALEFRVVRQPGWAYADHQRMQAERCRMSARRAAICSQGGIVTTTNRTCGGSLTTASSASLRWNPQPAPWSTVV